MIARPPVTHGSGSSLPGPASTVGRERNDSARAAEEAERNARPAPPLGGCCRPLVLCCRATVQFSAEALAAARSQQKGRRHRADPSNFIAGDKRRESLRPMPGRSERCARARQGLRHCHRLCDDGPRRHTSFPYNNVFLPGVRLSDAAKASPAAAAAAAAAALAAAFEIQLTDVECSKAALDTTLRQLAGEYVVQHSGRPADGSPMKVSLLFEHEKSARLALEIMGGGVRGQFAGVLTPDWIKAARRATSIAAPLRAAMVATMVAASGTMLPASTDGLG